jgi:hypothetical protein
MLIFHNCAGFWSDELFIVRCNIALIDRSEIGISCNVFIEPNGIVSKLVTLLK